MLTINTASVGGRLGDNATVRRVNDKRVAIGLRVANPNPYKRDENGKPEVTWFNVTYFRSGTPDDENVKKLAAAFTKGREVVATGRIAEDEYTDKNGVKCRVPVIYANSIEYASTPADSASSTAPAASAAPAASTAPAAPAASTAPAADDWMNYPSYDDELPFN